MTAIHSRNKPKVSVIIPVQNRKQIVQKVLAGLEHQDCADFEVIVVDDGSHDGTREWLSEFEQTSELAVHIFSTAGLGAATARNQGALQAHGDILLFLDADTIPDTGLIREHIMAHQEHTFGRICIMGKIVMSPELMTANQVRWQELDLPYPAGTVIQIGCQKYRSANTSIKKCLFEEAGGFHPGLIASEDLEFAYRLEKIGVTFFYHDNIMATHHHPMSFAEYINKGKIYGKAVAYWHRTSPEMHLDLAQRYGLYHRSLPMKTKLRYVVKIVLVNHFSIGIIVTAAKVLRKKWFDVSDRLYKAIFGYYLRREFQSYFHNALCVLGIYC